MAINAAEKMTRSEFVESVTHIWISASASRLYGINVTLSMPEKKKWAWPKGFPRGELLSVSSDGDFNYSFDPEKILKWILKTKNQFPA